MESLYRTTKTRPNTSFTTTPPLTTAAAPPRPRRNHSQPLGPTLPDSSSTSCHLLHRLWATIILGKKILIFRKKVCRQ
ncbi:hypothetical protein RHMOL_Rhmol05G0170800 [Rhododendron molle]|uniref:Uncharacterized protein n=1 Tax=Rhododendron molle TaxID=49168 RepID=A0ACC0NR16_RHOML|nr:hypothetical protein RHMOL_Rhmol05G0170800 [Rhododendron molle]